MRGLAAVVVVLGVLAGPGAASALAWTWTVEPAAVPEGDAITVTVTRQAMDPESFTITTGETADTATSLADYTAPSPNPLTWTMSDFSTKTSTIQTVEDTLDEGNETLTVKVASGSGASTTPLGSITRTIEDDDAPPALAVGDASVVEGTGATPSTLSFPVTLSAASGQPITVDYATADGTAIAGQDYTATSGTLTIPAGQTTAAIEVPVTADAAIESNETFTIALSNPGNATLGTPTATGTITNDDTLPTLSIVAPAPTAEGSSGTTTPFDFAISLSKPSATPVTVAYSTADGAATAPADFAAADEQQVTFAPGETSKTVSVAVRADNEIEPNEDFSLTISETGGLVATVGSATATIVDDDAPVPAPNPGGGSARDTTSPAIRLSKVSSSRGIVRVRVACPVGEQVCRGTVSVFSVPARKSKVKALRREVRLGSSLFVLQGGQKGQLTFRPSARVSRLLRKASRVRVRAYAVARDAAGNVGTARSKGTVRAGGGSG